MEPYYGRPIPKYPYSAIVYKNGNKVIARDMDGKLIAKGTAGADDARVVQSAWDTIKSGVLYIASGEYDFGGNVLKIGGEHAKSNISIVGSGIGKTIIKNGGISKNDETPTYNVEIRDLTIDVNGQPGLYAININRYSTNFIIERVELKNSYDKFLLHWGGSRNLMVKNCIFYRDINSIENLDMAAGSQDLQDPLNRTSYFIGNTFIQKAGGGGLTTGSTGNIVFKDNIFVNYTSGQSIERAISIEATTAKCKKIIIENNKIYNLNNDSGAVSIEVATVGDYGVDHVIINNCIIINGHIIIRNADYTNMQNVRVINSNGTGIYFSGNLGIIECSNLIVEKSGYSGIYINSGRAMLSNIHVVDNNAHGVDAGEDCQMILSNSYIKNNSISSQGTYSGVVLRGNNQHVIGCIIIDDRPSPLQKYGIEEKPGGDNNLIAYNKIIGNYYGAVYKTGINTIILNNIGYTTENHGIATITGDGSTTQFTIPHGLVSTPNYVNVIPKGSSPNPDSIDWDDTNITLTFNTAPGSGTYYYAWEARI